MNKTEILTAAQDEGIPLSIHQLNRYIQLGLLPSIRKGNGYKSGVGADYPDAMPNIRFIEQARQDPRLKSNEHLLPHLFWNGYSVRTKDLQAYMLDYQQTVQHSFQKLGHDDPTKIDLEWFLDEMIDDPNVRPPRAPGRPGKDEQTKRLAEDQELRMFIQGIIKWMHQLIDNSPIQAREIMVSLSVGHIQEVDPSHPFLYQLQSSLDSFRWLEPGETIDWDEISILITALQEYEEDWEWITSTFFPPTVTRVPEMFKAHPQMDSLLLLFVLISRQASALHTMLTTDAFRRDFQHLMSLLKGGLLDAPDSITR